MIRIATHADIPKLVAWGRNFHEASRLPCGFDPDAFGALLLGMIDTGSAVVLMTDSGFIGGMISPAYCDPTWPIAVELFWWAERDGLRLLRAFEAWALENKAREIRMSSLASLPRGGRVITRKGYVPAEISYTKVM